MAQGQVIVEDDGSKRDGKGERRPASKGNNARIHQEDAHGNGVPMCELITSGQTMTDTITGVQLTNVAFTLPGNAPQSINNPSTVVMLLSECPNATCSGADTTVTWTVQNSSGNVTVTTDEVLLQNAKGEARYRPENPSVVSSVQVNGGTVFTASGNGEANVKITFS